MGSSSSTAFKPNRSGYNLGSDGYRYGSGYGSGYGDDYDFYKPTKKSSYKNYDFGNSYYNFDRYPSMNRDLYRDYPTSGMNLI